MNLQLRKSGYNDYVAVDDVDKKGNDAEENKYYRTEVTFDGDKLLCHSLNDDMEWDSPLDELTDGTFKPLL